MKKVLYGLALAALCSCGQGGAKNGGKTIINGVIKNAAKKEIALSASRSDFTEKKLDDKNFVRFELKIDKPGYYQITQGRGNSAPIFVMPGDSIYFEAEGKLTSTKFSGDEKEQNEYLKEKAGLMQKARLNYQEVFTKNESEFIKDIDGWHEKISKEQSAMLSKLKNKNDKFVKYEKASLLYTWADLRISYPMAYKYFTKKDIELSKSYNIFQKKLNLNDPSLLVVQEYKQFMNSYITSFISDDKNKNSGVELSEKLQIVSKKIENKELKSHLAYEVMATHIQHNGIAGVDNSMKLFKDLCSNKENLDKIEKEYNSWNAIKVGKPAPNFEANDINGKKHTLSEYKGKYVYIDVWATWCGPCRREIPALKKLEEEMHDKNIVFMSVSVDKDKAAWEQMVKKDDMQGVQLHAAKAWDSKLAKSFKINSIPRFILIDKEGKIINSSAERPSGNIKKILEGLKGI